MKIKKEKLFPSILAIMLLTIGFSLSKAYAATSTLEDDMIQQTVENSHISAISATTISDGNSDFYSFGENINEDRLFYIGSLSKAFTAYAILYLVEADELSLSEPITTYIPWFEAIYQGQNVANQITIETLLNQKSGFINDEIHFPNVTTQISLEDNIRRLSGKELAFSPTEKFSYANANYNVLGYIIEQITKTSYADFMEQQIFLPLGLKNTYASPKTATDTLVSGTRITFGKQWHYDIEIGEGIIPAGYIISNTKDLNRWLQIQLGTIQLPAPHTEIVQQSQRIDEKNKIKEGVYYTNGWYINPNKNKMYHSGGTPNYSSRLTIDTENKQAVAVLTNMNTFTNTIDIANNLMLLLQEKSSVVYRQDMWKTLDMLFSIFILVILTITISFILIMIKKRKKEKMVSKIWYLLPSTMLFLPNLFLVLFPMTFKSNLNLINIWIWIPLNIKKSLSLLYIWAPLSMLIAVSLMILSAIYMFISIRWFRAKKEKI